MTGIVEILHILTNLSKTEKTRLLAVQKEVQESVTELDRARFAYHTEESECIKTAERAEEAELKAKGGMIEYR